MVEAVNNEEYVVYMGKENCVRGTRINGQRPTHVHIYAQSCFMGSKDFREFTRTAAASLEGGSDPKNVIIHIIKHVDTEEVFNILTHIKHDIELRYQKELVETKVRVEQFKGITELSVWEFIKYKWFTRNS